jgi:NAD(P)-dependent dehydrogenase (short-subunit alcohol dehydrogenase family)
VTAGRTAAAIAAGLAGRAAWQRARALDLTGKVALVTGGSRGLGFAIARELVREGARVAFCARGEDALERARRKLAAAGGDVLATRCDVSRADEVERWVSDAVRHFGGVDVLVNNAGVISVGPLRALTREDFAEAMDIHFWGTLNPTLAALPHLRRAERATIANVTSIGGKISAPHLLAYTPSKYAAVGLSQGLRAELAHEGVRVVTVVPGLMRTGSYLAAFFKGDARLEYTLFAPFSSSPANTIAGERAARRVVHAIRLGQPEVILTVHANLLTRLNGLVPGATADAMAVAARLLPKADAPTERVRGADVRSRVDRSFLTALGRRAARSLNQVR